MGLYNRLGIASRLDKAPIGGLEVAPIVPLLLKPSDLVTFCFGSVFTAEKYKCRTGSSHLLNESNHI